MSEDFAKFCFSYFLCSIAISYIRHLQNTLDGTPEGNGKASSYESTYPDTHAHIWKTTHVHHNLPNAINSNQSHPSTFIPTSAYYTTWKIIRIFFPILNQRSILWININLPYCVPLITLFHFDRFNKLKVGCDLISNRWSPARRHVVYLS